MFTFMEGGGNGKQLVGDVIEVVLKHLQNKVETNLDKFDVATANWINIDIITLVVFTRVLVNNPMYDSPALTLQLRNELSRILDGAEGFKLNG